MESTANKVLVVGLDGATLDLVRPWVEAGQLPHLARLMSEGAYGQLRSTLPPITAPAWTSFMTGKNIGKHGLVDFIMRKPGTQELLIVNAKSRDGEPLWKILSASGKKVGVVNVPMTYPPEEVNGFLVSGMDTPTLDKGFTYPLRLKTELLNRVPNYRIEAGGHNLIRGRRRDYPGFISEMLNTEEARFAATHYLMDKHPWDFFMVVFRATDRAQHWFWKHLDPLHPRREPGDEKYAEAILQAYQQADRFLGHFMSRLGDDTVLLVMSDHGAAPAGERVIYLNTWLRDQGFLAYRDGTSLAPQGVAWRLWTSLKRNLPSGTKKWLRDVFPRLERKLPSLFVFSEIDWTRTKAFAIEPREAIWINLAGRELQGAVQPGEYDKIRQEISEQLLAWRDPETGLPVVERVYRREELYSGPHLERVPDLLPVLARHKYRYQSARHGPGPRGPAIADWRSLGEQGMSRANGVHDLDGLFLFWGNGIRAGEIQGAQILDLAPTILHLMGEAVPADMDGEVLDEILENPLPVVKRAAMVGQKDLDQKTYSEEESQEVQERLRGLGYLD